MKVALVHDHLNQLGGAERVLLNFHNVFKDSPIFTLVHDQKALPPDFEFKCKTIVYSKFTLFPPLV